MSSAVTAVRGPLISFVDDPFLTSREEAFVFESDGLLICQDGVITASGEYGALRDQPGFMDTHIHYVQTGIIAAFGSQLIDWLDHYTFVEEQRFSDPA
ncbi:hypothetical protein ACFCXF_20975 [Streptomyces virginiae]|uniref:hypothetical protein n=1 Tax=Streptomyces virginiae TaxID=1961 RepID=UPI0035DB564E